jgi:hypothetical protein
LASLSPKAGAATPAAAGHMNVGGSGIGAGLLPPHTSAGCS